MKNQQVIVNVGVSGSGKTTWTKEYLKQNPNALRINRDLLREHFYGTLDGYYDRKDVMACEMLITDFEGDIFMKGLLSGRSMVVDNTNLKPGYVTKWIHIVDAINLDEPEEKKVNLYFKFFPEINPDVLKKRVNIRDAPLGWDKLNYIDKQIQQYKGIVRYIQDNWGDKILK